MFAYYVQGFAGFVNLFCGNYFLGCCFLLSGAACLVMANVGGNEE